MEELEDLEVLGATPVKSMPELLAPSPHMESAGMLPHIPAAKPWVQTYKTTQKRLAFVAGVKRSFDGMTDSELDDMAKAARARKSKK